MRFPLPAGVPSSSRSSSSLSPLSRFIALVQERSGCRPCLSSLRHNNGHASNDPPVFGFDVHAPVPRIEPLLERIRPIAAFAAAGNFDRNLVGMCEGLAAVRSEVPMVVDGGVQRHRGENGGEAIYWFISWKRILRTLPHLIPFAIEAEHKPVVLLLHLAIHAAELHRERYGRNPIQEIEPDQEANEGNRWSS